MLENGSVCFTISRDMTDRWYVITRHEECKYLNRAGVPARYLGKVLMQIAETVNTDHKLGCIFDCE